MSDDITWDCGDADSFTGRIVGPTVREVIIDDEYRRLLDREVISRLILDAILARCELAGADNSCTFELHGISEEHTLYAADKLMAYIEEVLYDRY